MEFNGEGDQKPSPTTMPQMTHIVAYGTHSQQVVDLVRLAFAHSQCQQATIAMLEKFKGPAIEPTPIQDMSYVEIEEVLEYDLLSCSVRLLFSESPVTDRVDAIVDADKLRCDGPLERIQLCELSFQIGPHVLHIPQIDGDDVIIACNYSVDFSGYGTPMDSEEFETAVKNVYRDVELAKFVSPIESDFKTVVWYDT